jgi:hypothetical protein
MNQTSSRRRHPATRYQTHGWVTSLLFHLGVLVLLLVASFQPWWLEGWHARQARTLEVTLGEGPPASEPDRAVESVRFVADPSEVTADMVRERLDEVIAETEPMSEEGKFARLDELSNRLSQVSDEASVDAVAGVLQSLLGTQPRAVQPADEPVAGQFDYDTAQFHDIRRVPTDDGGFRYLTVLLDAEGRTIEVEMSQADGETVYLTMQRVKANPLLEQVYRQIVMPLIDQMLAAMRQAETAGGLQKGTNLDGEQGGAEKSEGEPAAQ